MIISHPTPQAGLNKCEETHTSGHPYQEERNSRASISIEQRRGFDKLPAIPTPLALVRVVCIADGGLVKLEQLTEVVRSEVPSCIFRFIYHACREVLLLASAERQY
jgi:hypothetical protein